MATAAVGARSTSNINFPAIDWAVVSTHCKAFGYRIASYLSDPALNIRDHYFSIKIVDKLHATESNAHRVGRKILLGLQLCGNALLSTVTTLFGIAIRSAISNVEKEPFLHFKGDLPEKTLPGNRKFTHLNWNICATPGGFAITDGGLVPWAERIDRIAQAIIDQNADVVSLFEVFDLHAGFYLYKKLKPHYSHLYFNIGAHAIGPNSGSFFASKYKVQDASFTPYEKKSLVWTTKFAEKGFFHANLVSDNNVFASLYETHLQHSNVPSDPTEAEVKGRKKQMKALRIATDKDPNKCVVIAGDLNMDDAELQALKISQKFTKGDREAKKSWGGDKFCVELAYPERNVSGERNLDHTMVRIGKTSIKTTLTETHFNAESINTKALSDHKGLISTIEVNNDNTA